jgi:hypothetical protein
MFKTLIKELFLSTYNAYVCFERVHVHKQVYPSCSKGVHASRVVCRRIDVVNANGIGTKLLHQVGIKLALVCVDERVLVDELVGDT